ncbi:uncharacterized protein LOC144175326 [Haemaphysalis longicornis]
MWIGEPRDRSRATARRLAGANGSAATPAPHVSGDGLDKSMCVEVWGKRAARAFLGRSPALVRRGQSDGGDRAGTMAQGRRSSSSFPVFLLLVSLTLSPGGAGATLFLNGARQWCTVCPQSGQPFSSRYALSAFCCSLFSVCCPQGTGLNPYRGWKWT